MQTSSILTCNFVTPGMPLNILGLGAGGGCGVGLGLGWGFGSAFGSQYRSSRVTFECNDLSIKGPLDGRESSDISKSNERVQ